MFSLHKLKVKLSLIIAIITLMMAITINLLVGHYSRGQIEQDQTTLLEQVALTMMSRLQQDMSVRANEILFLSQREMLRDASISVTQKQKILDSIRKNYPHYAWIGITDKDGNILVGTDGNLVGKNVAKRDWFLLGAQGLHFGDAHDAFLLAKMMPKPKWDDLPLRLVDISAPMVNEQGELIGVICGHLSLDWAFEARNAILDQLSKQKLDLVVVNKEDKVLMGTPALPSLAVDLSGLKTLQSMQYRSLDTQIEIWSDQKSYLTVAAKETGFGNYPGMGWRVVARKLESQAFEKADQLQWLISAFTLVVTLFFILLISRIISKQLRPLEQISEAAEQISHQDLSTPLPIPQGQDELAVLAKNLAQLVGHLQANNAELKLAGRVFEDSHQGIMITDAEQKVIRVNHAFTHITGYDANEAVGQRPSFLASGRQTKEFYAQMWQSIEKNGFWQGEIWNKHRTGYSYPEWLSIHVLYDDQGQVIHYIGIFDDITDKKNYEQRLVHLANYDSLTDLPNRHLMQRQSHMMIEHALINNQNVGLIFIDLDKFKHINDSLGHPVGDQILVETAVRFKQEITPDMVLSRWGGDEFVLVMPNCDQFMIGQLIKRLLTTLHRPFMLNQSPYHLSMSAGVAFYPRDAQTVEQLLRCADTAMYQAKHEGSNLYRFYEGSMHKDVSRFIQLDNALRNALQHHGLGLRMVFQPQFHTDGKMILGVEALIRWHDDQLGFVSPGEFIPVAEETGQVIALGYWIAEAVAHSYHQLIQQQCRPVPISINCSARQLTEVNLAKKLHEVFVRYQVPAEHIIIEVTESAVMGNEAEALKTLTEFKDYGYHISVDDFGTGYSCLSYMQKIAPSEVKIDQRFVDSMATNSDSHSIVVFTHGLAQSMGINVVAEGVETQEQLNLLKAIGEDIRIQGYLLAKPMEFDDFAALLKQVVHG